MEKVTIGIPVYNAEKFIRNTLISIFNQTYSNFELIITDDGSTDDSLNIIKSFTDNRIRIYSDGENKGISYRLNQQVNLAKGKYFVRMDADDIMFPNRLEKQLAFLENNPNCDVVGSSIIVINDDNDIIGFRPPSFNKNEYDTLQKITFHHPSVMGKKSWFLENNYKVEYSGVEDFELWHRTIGTSNFGMIKEPLLFYRDPLVFKLSTYMHRQKQMREVFKKSNYLKNKPILLKKMIIGSYLKGYLSIILHLLKLDEKMISRRNQPCDKINNYNTILKKNITDGR